jgi:hypothetical protein
MKIENRAWDELRSAGNELSKHVIEYGEIAAVVGRVARQFELPSSPEAEAVSGFLIGLLNALDEAAAMAEIEVDADDATPEAAQ